MANDKIVKLADQLSKADLEIVLEVNRKAIEINSEVAGQNEEIIESLGKMDIKIDNLTKSNELLSRNMFEIRALFATGILSLVVQIVLVFLRH